MNILGIDIGTGGTRAVLIDATGVVVATETAEHPPFESAPLKTLVYLAFIKRACPDTVLFD